MGIFGLKTSKRRLAPFLCYNNGMPRKPRIFFENAHYHVTDRGNDKQDVFTDDFDRREYLRLLGQGKQDFGLLIPA